MGFFTVRTVKCDKQMANAYILYMMAGSLFGKARFTNSKIEGRLRNQYRELAVSKQEQQEAYTENMLKRRGSVYEAFYEEVFTGLQNKIISRFKSIACGSNFRRFSFCDEYL